MTDQKRLGRMRRNKGQTFERTIVHAFQEAFAGEKWTERVRRSDQGFGAVLSDVTGVPLLWIECQHAHAPTPEAKLDQAIEDCNGAADRDEVSRLTIPIAITKQTGRRSSTVTIRLRDFSRLIHWAGDRPDAPSAHIEKPVALISVNLDFDDFLALYRSARQVWKAYA